MMMLNTGGKWRRGEADERRIHITCWQDFCRVGYTFDQSAYLLILIISNQWRETKENSSEIKGVPWPYKLHQQSTLALPSLSSALGIFQRTPEINSEEFQASRKIPEKPKTVMDVLSAGTVCMLFLFLDSTHNNRGKESHKSLSACSPHRQKNDENLSELRQRKNVSRAFLKTNSSNFLLGTRQEPSDTQDVSVRGKYSKKIPRTEVGWRNLFINPEATLALQLTVASNVEI